MVHLLDALQPWIDTILPTFFISYAYELDWCPDDINRGGGEHMR